MQLNKYLLYFETKFEYKTMKTDSFIRIYLKI